MLPVVSLFSVLEHDVNNIDIRKINSIDFVFIIHPAYKIIYYSRFRIKNMASWVLSLKSSFTRILDT